MKVLVADDEPRLASLLEQSLVELGWTVDVVADGRSAYLAGLGDAGYDVLLLDWMLPGMEGITVCRRLREAGVRTPILVLTARTTVPDRVAGLRAGADDYLPKPFDLDELVARLQALHRRARDEYDEPLAVGDLVLDPGSRRVRRGSTAIDLSAREFDILRLLMSRAGRLVTRLAILDEVWDGDTDVRSNVIDVHVASVRAKIDRPFGTSTITTLRGSGYRIDPG
ncbi:response regulator transcription factor [Nocardioides rubriscoriae]|uniref:response regulator transcription factor n=1 Tax=Nocardioides rubriscoriae TaxID=642762 RepID=UPI0011E0501E|nr:response regulator transcription factor [Nocardioides rubriscoriae]